MKMTLKHLAVPLLALALATTSSCGRFQKLEQEESMTRKLTWQEAKASTQAMELAIVEHIPKADVLEVDQMEKGTLFSCDQTRHNWNGATTVTLATGVEVESIVRGIESEYQNSRFEISTRFDFAGNYEVHLIAPDGTEGYLIGEGLDENTISIDSGSACFTLPEDVYPGGLF